MSNPDSKGLSESPKPSELEKPVYELVERFSAALLEKLLAAEKKYDWDNGWRKDDWADDLRRDIRKHVDKGDPRDVAAYCAFAWHHGWTLKTEKPESPKPEPSRWIPVEEKLPDFDIEVLVFSPDEEGGGIFCDHRTRNFIPARLCTDKWDTGDGNGLKITHWQPLPDPPKGKP